MMPMNILFFSKPSKQLTFSGFRELISLKTCRTRNNVREGHYVQSLKTKQNNLKWTNSVATKEKLSYVLTSLTVSVLSIGRSIGRA